LSHGQVVECSKVPDRCWKQGLPRLDGHIAAVREVILHDAPTLFDLLSDPRVSAHMSAPPPSVHAFEGFIAWAQAERKIGRGVCFGIVPHGLDLAVGIIQLRTVEPTFCIAEWGFAMGVAFWSTGVFVETAELVARFAFETLRVQRLEARVMPTNGRGNGVLQKLGATVEAVLSRSLSRAGRYEEQLFWSLTKEAWDQRTLVRPMFCPSDAKARIADAVAGTQEALRHSKPQTSGGVAPLYPFFLVDSGPKPST
jgi:ribosomal-protein-alanine N-acetyltransferase